MVGASFLLFAVLWWVGIAFLSNVAAFLIGCLCSPSWLLVWRRLRVGFIRLVCNLVASSL